MPFIGKQSTSNSQITNYTTTVGSGGQTNFTVVIEGGDETHVYLNGVLLKETTDYTVTSTQVSLVSPAVENDIVEIKVFRSFALVDAVKATGGTFSGNVTIEGTDPGVGNALLEAKLTSNSNHPCAQLINENTGGNVDDNHGLLIDNRGGSGGGQSYSIRVKNNTTENFYVKADGKIYFGGVIQSDVETATNKKVKQKGAFLQSSTHQSLVLGY